MSSEEIKANIQQIIKTFHHFVALCENEIWLKTVTTVDIKNAFKCATFVEKAMEKAKAGNLVENLLESVNSGWESEGRTKVYEEDFYALACDNLLEVFFTNRGLSVGNLDVAVRMYSAMNPPERLEKALGNCLLKSLSYKAITNYVLVNKERLDVEELECKVLLVYWADELKKGNSEQIKTAVDSMLDYYIVDKSFSVLFKILSFSGDESENSVRNLIVGRIEPKISERNILSKKYWLALFKGITFEVLLKACKEQERILQLVLDLVVYLVTMLELVEGFWVADNTAICPEINYFDLIKILESFYSDSTTQPLVKQKILEAVEQIGLPIWHHVQTQIIK